jgi:hypothetical protein
LLIEYQADTIEWRDDRRTDCACYPEVPDERGDFVYSNGDQHFVYEFHTLPFIQNPSAMTAHTSKIAGTYESMIAATECVDATVPMVGGAFADDEDSALSGMS